MKSYPRKNGIVAVLALSLQLTGCVYIAPRLETKLEKNVNPAVFNKKTLVIHRRNRVHGNPAGAPFLYGKFANAGISDSMFQMRVDSAFFSGLVGTSIPEGIQIDSSLPPQVSTDSVSFPFEDSFGKIAIAKAGVDPNRLHLFFSSIDYAYSTSCSYDNSSRHQVSPTSTTPYIAGTLHWIVFDPSVDKPIAGGSIRDVSFTSTFWREIVTLQDWYKAASFVGADLRGALVKLTKSK